MAQPNHWCRAVMNAQTHELVKTLEPERLDVLEISGVGWHDLARFKSYRSARYPGLDICSQKLHDQFDLIIAEQVFEHLAYPQRAARNCLAMLRPGGHLLITVPFLIKVHPSPLDCTRWTAEGLRYMLEDCGFYLDRIIVGSWGNRACVAANFEEWPDYNPELHSLINEPEFPLVTWALAQAA
jgi:SAM-dependent methyltransferase